MAYFTLDEVSASYRTGIKAEYMDNIICKNIKSIYGIDLEME